ncbi:MAG: divalent-cation tolerance protein CutA [Acidimicrobiia bacterium]
MAETNPHVLVMITCGSDTEARTIARHLVTNRLAAGAQIIPIQSVYTWQEEVVEDDEWLLICKTRREVYEQVESAVQRLHSYEVVPIYMVSISEGGRTYLDWIDETTGDRGSTAS